MNWDSNIRNLFLLICFVGFMVWLSIGDPDMGPMRAKGIVFIYGALIFLFYKIIKTPDD